MKLKKNTQIQAVCYETGVIQHVSLGELREWILKENAVELSPQQRGAIVRSAKKAALEALRNESK